MRYRIEVGEPAAEFEDGFPIGNGWLGAMLRGRPGVELLDLNADTLWSGGPLTPEPGPPPARLLPRLRQAIADGEHLLAEELARRLQGAAWTQSYQPLGRIEWRYGDQRAVSGYRRSLDLAEAEAVTEYASASGPVRLTALASNPDGVVVLTATGPGAVPAAITPRLHSPHPDVAATRLADCLVWTGRAPAHVLPNYVVDRDPAVLYDIAVDAAGTVAAGMGFAVAAAVRRYGPGARLLITAVTGFRGPGQRPSADLNALAAAAVARLTRALAVAPDELRARHVADHRRLFAAADLDLSRCPPGDAHRAERLFHLGRYLLVAGSRPGTQPANLQGIWNADVRPGWSSNWTLNINAQMNYWAAESTGRPELHEPLLALARDLSVAGERTARRHYAVRGAAAHHNTDLWRFTAPVPGDPQWANWPSALLWLSAHAWDHLDHGAPAEFGRSTALPILRAAARFTLDMLVDDGAGALVFSPSTSPEHHFLVGTAAHAATSRGCAMDQELAREVLTRFTALSARWPAPADAALTREAAAALSALRPVQRGPDGSLLEWYDERPPREPGHRHLSHLYGLYPGTRITETATPDDFAAARLALHTRLVFGSGHTGWSRAWILCLAARLRDRALAAHTITALLDELCSASLLTLHPDTGRPSGWIFQIDGNLGVVAGITELLVQSHDGAISLLRALPPAWTEGRVAGIRCRGGHTATVTWSAGTLTEASITAATSGPLVVECSAPARITTAEGIPVAATPVEEAPSGRHRRRWAARAGATYRVRPAG
ncbi:glycoside hydrolase family 95 protein [Dactylosporangium sp. CA-233914]|uniref:glycoside hydrolase family 95 protein n=1 Tax=Dactylosporangium sp. CA-233914 TaxID=3239934 RepID=UPI003D900970